MDWVKKRFASNSYSFIFLLNDCSDNTENLIIQNFQKYPYKILKSNDKRRGSGLNLAFKKLRKKQNILPYVQLIMHGLLIFTSKHIKKLKKLL